MVKQLILAIWIIIMSTYAYAQGDNEDSKFILQGGTGMIVDFQQMSLNKSWAQEFNYFTDYDAFVNGPISWFSLAYKLRDLHFVEASFASGWTYSTVYDYFNLLEEAPMHFPQYYFNIGFRSFLIKNQKNKLSVGAGLGIMFQFYNDVDYMVMYEAGNNPVIYNLDFLYQDVSDLLLSINASYSYNIYKNLNIGLKASASYGVHFGFNTLIVSPLLEVEF